MGGESAGVARANDGRSRSEALLREGAASGRRGRPELCAGRYHFSARRSGGGTTLSDAVGFDCAALIRSSHATQRPAPDRDEKRGQGQLAVHAIQTEDWLGEIAPASPPARTAKWQAGLQVRR